MVLCLSDVFGGMMVQLLICWVKLWCYIWCNGVVFGEIMVLCWMQ